MLATSTVTLLATALVLAGPAAASILIEDPAGDVVIQGVAAGPAGAAYDLREVRLFQEGDRLRLQITLESVPGPHDSAEFVVVFQSNGTWMAGYTALPYTDPAPHYRGGFACPATQDGFVDGSQGACIGISDWSLEGTTYTVDVPLTFLRAQNGTLIDQAWAYSEVTPYLKGDTRVDTTSQAGSLYVGSTIPAPAQPEKAMHETAGPSALVFVVGLVLVANARHRDAGRNTVNDNCHVAAGR